MLLGIVYAILCSLLWGVSYFCLIPVSVKLQPETINMFFAMLLFIFNLVWMIAKNSFGDFAVLFQTDWSLILYIFGYALLSCVASTLYLFGYKVIGENYAGAFNAISSTYPVIIFILSFIFFNQRDYNLYMVIPGILLTCIGIVLLSVAK